MPLQTQLDYSIFIKSVCYLSDCRYSITKTRSRKREVVQARQLIIAYRHCILGLTQEQSTKPFGMDHSSTGHCINTIQDLYLGNKHYRFIFGKLLETHYEILAWEKNMYDKDFSTQKTNQYENT